MRRVPIRLRVTGAFTAAMALVLMGVGAFLFLRQEAQLGESIDNGLRSRADELLAHAGASGARLHQPGTAALIESDESFAQILTVSGRPVDSTPQLRSRPVLSPSQLQRARSSPVFFERGGLPGIEAEARLLATPIDPPASRLVAVVGASLGDRDEALGSLATLLVVGGGVALLLASLVGYWAIGRALHPVEEMRRRAAAISASGPEERLPVPAADDELRRLGRTLNEMLERIEATLERERRFVDDASHELRTPLALHRTELELALRHGGTAQELRAALVSGLGETDRLIQLAEDLLVVARSEDGKLALALEPLPVSDLLATLGERFAARAEESGRRLVVEEAEGGVIVGDRLRLEQALTNTVDNALRHGGGEVRIWARRSSRGIELHVGDRGPGLPPEFVHRAFERFSRADAARSSGGSGLGLAIVEAIAVAHGGRAGAANDPSGGADVWIEVPDP
jgi:signal transduction histidine kinase